MDPVALVRAWTEAWNARDAEALAAIADDAILLELPRGGARGIAALREVIARQSFGVRLFVGPQEFHTVGDTVISVGPTEFRQVEEDDRVVGRDEEAAAVFSIRDGRIARFKPYPDPIAALEGEGLPPDALGGAPRADAPTA